MLNEKSKRILGILLLLILLTSPVGMMLTGCGGGNDEKIDRDHQDNDQDDTDSDDQDHDDDSGSNDNDGNQGIYESCQEYTDCMGADPLCLADPNVGSLCTRACDGNNNTCPTTRNGKMVNSGCLEIEDTAFCAIICDEEQPCPSGMSCVLITDPVSICLND